MTARISKAIDQTYEDIEDQNTKLINARNGSRPNPDPTLLTTRLVDKAVLALRDELGTRFESMAEATKLVRDQHTKLVDDVPIQLAKAVLSLREYLSSEMGTISQTITSLESVSKERFSGISIQFEERDRRTEQLSQAQKEAANALSLASATAIAAALQAQKEAAGAQNDSNAASITKSEAAFTKQIDQITVLITAIQKGNDDKTNDLKASIATLASRIDRGEGSTSGIEANRALGYDERTERRGNTSSTTAIVSAVVAGMSLIVAVAAVLFAVTHAVHS